MLLCEYVFLGSGFQGSEFEYTDDNSFLGINYVLGEPLESSWLNRWNLVPALHPLLFPGDSPDSSVTSTSIVGWSVRGKALIYSSAFPSVLHRSFLQRGVHTYIFVCVHRHVIMSIGVCACACVYTRIFIHICIYTYLCV